MVADREVEPSLAGLEGDLDWAKVGPASAISDREREGSVPLRPVADACWIPEGGGDRRAAISPVEDFREDPAGAGTAAKADGVEREGEETNCEPARHPRLAVNTVLIAAARINRICFDLLESAGFHAPTMVAVLVSGDISGT